MKKPDQTFEQLFSELELIYHTAPVGMALVDTDLRYIRANKRLAEIVGKSPEDLIGKTIHQIIPEMAAKVEPIYRRVIETGEPSLINMLEGVIPSTPDMIRFFLASYHPLIEDGAVRYVSAVVQDITGIKKTQELLQEREHIFSAFMDHSSTIIYIKNSLNEHLYANKILLEKFGIAMEAFIGTRARDFLPPDLADRLESLDQKILAGQADFESVEYIVEMDGRETWWQDNKFPIVMPSGERCVGGVSLEMTDRKLAEQSLKEQLDFERLISDISTEFINAPLDEVDDVIREALGRVCSFLALDRATIDLLSEDKSCFKLSHLWMAPGVCATADTFQQVLNKEAPWLTGRILNGESIFFSDVEKDLPPEAAGELARIKEWGIQSTAVVPLVVNGEVIGACGLSSIAARRDWPEQFKNRMRLLSQTFANVLTRQKDKQALIEKLRFENLIAGAAAQLAQTNPERLTETIDSTLRALGDFLQTERAFFAQFSGDEQSLVFTNTWAAEGYDPHSIIFEMDVVSDVPWLAEYILGGGVVVSGPGLTGFPAEAQELRRQLEQDGINSGVVVPVRAEGRSVGLLGLDTIDQPRTYPTSIVDRLRIVADMIGSTLLRVRAQTALQDSLEQVKRLKEQADLENIYLRREARLVQAHGNIVGQSGALRKELERIEQVAGTNSTVLIEGETGTGKELFAESVHNLSARKEKLLVKVNCAALPETLVESELFGREKGAYTGAMSKMVGRFELADRGSIFLDEVGELSLEMQAKLLRVLQEGEFERLGSSKTVKVDVRVIAATNRNLEKAVQEGTFREDLFYRLSVFRIHVPPLTERADDIPQLVWHFVEELSEHMGKRIDHISKRTMDSLQRYTWPGNVRQLRNIIENAMIISPGLKLVVELPKAAGLASTKDRTMEEVERRHVEAVLDRCGWRVSGAGGAAEILGLKPTTLRSRMNKLGIERPE